MKMPNKYYDLWYFRLFFELERFAAGVKDMLVSPWGDSARVCSGVPGLRRLYGEAREILSTGANALAASPPLVLVIVPMVVLP